MSDDNNSILAAMDALNHFTEPLAHRALDINIMDAMKGKRIE